MCSAPSWLPLQLVCTTLGTEVAVAGKLIELGCSNMTMLAALCAGYGTNSTINSGTTCELAPQGYYSPGGAIATTQLSPCPTGYTTAPGSTGATSASSCNHCAPGDLQAR
jgi:hypothetical protein